MADLSSVMDGIFFDELSKLRILDADKAADTQNLREESKEFSDSLNSEGLDVFKHFRGGAVSNGDRQLHQTHGTDGCRC